MTFKDWLEQESQKALASLNEAAGKPPMVFFEAMRDVFHRLWDMAYVSGYTAGLKEGQEQERERQLWSSPQDPGSGE